MPTTVEDGLQEPLVEKAGGSTSVHGGGKTSKGLVAAVLALLYFCGPYSPLPSWLSQTLLVLACIPVVVLLLQLVLVKALEAAIESFDRTYLGVDVNIEYLSVNVFVGRIQVSGITVNNPEGYRGPFLLKADNLVLDLDMKRTILSKGLEIEISELTGQGVLANLEFDGYLYGKSNANTIVEHIKAASGSKSDIQPVYNYWHAGNSEHTFHFDPAWSGEERLGCVFYAHKTQVEGTGPVYDYWHSWYRQHSFRMGETGISSLEWRGDVQFYAFKEKAEGTEPIHEFWHVGNQENTYHFMPPWDREEAGEVAFHAYRSDPTGSTKGKELAAVIKPVYDFWHSGQGQHQFHFLPAWGGEKKGNVQFYAFSKQEPGTEPVYDFYNKSTNKKTFHLLGQPRDGEERYSRLFYVYTSEQRGTVPIYEFWHEGNQEFNIHAGDPWEGEERREVMFYAHIEDPVKTKKILLRKVTLQGVKARSDTKIMGASVSLDDIVHENFCEEFEAVTPDKIVQHLLDIIFAKVRLRLW